MRPAQLVAVVQLVGVALVAIALGLVAVWLGLLWLGLVLLVGGLYVERYVQPAEQSQEVDRARSNEAA